MARELTREYARHEQCNLPFAHFGMHHGDAPEQVTRWVRHSSEYVTWLASLANRIQLARGGKPISISGRVSASLASRFRKSALYQELDADNSSASALVSYGHYMRLTVVNTYAKNALGCTDEEVTISTWLNWDTDESTENRVEAPEPDFLVMQNWTRQKLNDIARPQYLAIVDDLRALVRKHDLGGEPTFRRMLAARRVGEDVDGRGGLQEDGLSDGPHRRRIIPSLCARPIATTKLLAGLHGGLFVYNQTFDEEGSYWFSTMFCLADRDAVTHEVDDDDQ